jgi:hypothetical protein
MPPHPTEPGVQFGASEILSLLGMPILKKIADNFIIRGRLAIEKEIVPDRVKRSYSFHCMNIKVS